jgi:hypothetical protein
VAVQYVESLDSVRTRRAPGDPEDAAHLAELQAFFEVIVVLALGREIAVPQSYAFDSAAFLRVARRVLNARQLAAPDSEDRPFRPHLFGTEVRTGTEIRSFDQAISDMLRRAGNPGKPFHSSLHPAVNALGPGEAEEAARDLDGHLPALVGETFAEPLAQVRHEFHVTARLDVPDDVRKLRLEGLLSDFMDPGSRVSLQAAALRGAQKDTYRRLRAALTELDPSVPETFNQRSRLRQEHAWPNDARGRSAAQILQGDLPLVLEFVDTLYNRVIAASMGAPPALYSTAPVRDDAAGEARYLAQELALGRPPLVSVDGDVEVPPLFEVSPKEGARKGARRTDTWDDLFDSGARALGPLLQARSRRRSPFWKSIRRIDDAMSTGERTKVDSAIRAHTDLVAELLRGRAEVSWQSDVGMDLAFETADTVIEVTVAPEGAVSYLLQGFLFAGSLAAQEGLRRFRGRGDRKQIASALGSVVTPVLTRPRP